MITSPVVARPRSGSVSADRFIGHVATCRSGLSFSDPHHAVLFRHLSWQQKRFPCIFRGFPGSTILALYREGVPRNTWRIIKSSSTAPIPTSCTTPTHYPTHAQSPERATQDSEDLFHFQVSYHNHITYYIYVVVYTRPARASSLINRQDDPHCYSARESCSSKPRMAPSPVSAEQHPQFASLPLGVPKVKVGPNWPRRRDAACNPLSRLEIPPSSSSRS